MDYLFKPTISFNDDNLSVLLAWEYHQITNQEELIDFTFSLFEQLEDYQAIKSFCCLTNDYIIEIEGAITARDQKAVNRKIATLESISYSLFSFITNKSYQTKQFETI